MSAAFAGRIVEKDIHKSSLIAAVCFAAGMAGTDSSSNKIADRDFPELWRPDGHRLRHRISFAGKDLDALVQE